MCVVCSNVCFDTRLSLDLSYTALDFITKLSCSTNVMTLSTVAHRSLMLAGSVTYKLGVIMHRCRHGKSLQYLVDCFRPVTDVVGRQRLRSATRQMMVVPRHRLSTVGRRAFTVQGPMV